MDEKEKEKLSELSPDVEKDMKKGKGYTTILANIVGDIRKRDVEKAVRLKNDKIKAPGLIKKFLKSVGWSEKEAVSIEEEALGEKKDDIARENIVGIEEIKEDELKVEVRHEISGIEEAGVIKFRGRDYMVLSTTTNEQSETFTFHLKGC
ncbi:MAG: hypothetical protein KAJ66_03275 [Candidatus Omnitrophica bacterium]|nr:hypothetical protein [Candidatus Omnitrophota bacterium]